MSGFRMLLDHFSFTLFHHEVPEPPVTKWSLDGLRWLATVMDHDDRDYQFAVGVFAYALGHEVITDKQMWRIGRVYDRVVLAYSRETLMCQQAVSCYSRRGAPERVSQ